MTRLRQDADQNQIITGPELDRIIMENYPEILRTNGDDPGSYWRNDSRRPWDAYVDTVIDMVAGSTSLRLDAGETALFRDALEHVLANTIDKRYPALRAREFIPMNNEVNPGAETVSVVGYEGIGEATLLNTYAEDVRMVDVQGKKATINVQGLAAGWKMTLQQVRAQAQAASRGYTADIGQKGMAMGRLAVETKVDSILARGQSERGIEGFTNLSAITPTAVSNGSWNGGATTPAQIVADILELRALIKSTKVWSPETMLLPTTLFAHLVSTELSAGSGVSLLDWIMKQVPGLTNVDEWDYLDTADTAGTGGRVIMYQRTPEVVEGYVPVELEALPPLQMPLYLLNIFHARCAGCHAANPTGIVYCDNAD